MILAGCSVALPQAPSNASNGSEHSTTLNASAIASGVPTASASGAPKIPVTPAGTKVKLGKWASYDYFGLDGQHAVIAARMTEFTKLTGAQRDEAVKRSPELASYNIFLMRVDEQKVTGSAVAFESDYTDFYPVLDTGVKAQSVTILNWSECSNQSFTKKFDEGNTILKQCYLGASKIGDPEPTGLIYAPLRGTYDYDEGIPLRFMS
jgi:hypothetical protein